MAAIRAVCLLRDLLLPYAMRQAGWIRHEKERAYESLGQVEQGVDPIDAVTVGNAGP